jgi:enoyl-CoA hydratase
VTAETYATLTYELRASTAWITINRPDRRNALSFETAVEIEKALLRAGADDAVRVVVLTGAGTAFSAGLDLAEYRTKEPYDYRLLLEQLYWRIYHAHVTLGKPTIAAVNGPARAAGCTMAFMCDMIVASESASFALPEVHVGLLPAYHLAHLPRIVGKQKAFEIAFTGEPVTATEAERLGIVNYVVPDDQLTTVVDTLVARLLKASPQALKVGKDTFYRVQDVEFNKAIQDAADAVVILASSKVTQEGLAAFGDKRKPSWA